LLQTEDTAERTFPASHQGRADEAARLARSRVLVVGLGGLGSPASLVLAAAGVGTLGLIDGDVVELSNLQRQVVHTAAALGRSKVHSAAKGLRRAVGRRQAPEVRLEIHDGRLDADVLPRLFADYDFVIDATDGAATKFMINDGAVATRTPYAHAGVVGWTGQTMTVLPGESACLRCLFPVAPDDGEPATCQTAGVVGSVVGAVGALQAEQAIAFLLGERGSILDRLLIYEALTARWRTVQLYRNPQCPACASGVAALADRNPSGGAP
jgi:adenylyltransferase/sulfurtransferase